MVSATLETLQVHAEALVLYARHAKPHIVPEIACMVGAMTGGLTKEKLQKSGGWKFVCEHAFDSTRKRMSVRTLDTRYTSRGQRK